VHASIKVSPKDMSQQPGPAFAGRADVRVGVELGELELVTGSRGRPESGRVLWWRGDDLWAKLGVA